MCNYILIPFAIFFGCLEIFFDILMLIGAMFAYFMVLSDKELNAFEYEMYSKFEILGLFELVWSVLLVIGAIKRCRVLLLPWVVHRYLKLLLESYERPNNKPVYEDNSSLVCAVHILVWFLMAVLYINMEKYKPINTPAKIENEKDLLTITIPEIQ